MEGTSAISPPHLDLRIGKIPATSSRILYDIPCKVCQDHSSGKHYGIFACDGCAGFFKRSIRRSRQYVCKAKSEGSCVVDKTHRNQCRACRLRKCVEAGMNKDAVQHERGPRNSTIRRQMALYFKESCDPSSEVGCGTSATAVLPQTHVLDLAQPKVGSPSSTSPEPSGHFIPSAAALIYAQALLPKVRLYSLPGQIVYLKHLQFGVGGGMILDKRSFLFPVKSNLFTPSLGIPAPFPFNSIEAVCESAARILFMNVKWAKSVPVFTKLNYKDQLLLLEESWRELFVLSAGQFMFPLELVQLLLAQITSMTETEKAETLAKEVKLFQETLIKFKQLHVDLHEYACLRAIVLFKTSFESSSSGSSPSSSSERKCLRDVAEIAALQDQTQLTLNKYISTAHPTQPFRFGKLLLLLPSLRLISNKTIEELFFRRTIGNIPIERIICDMYKSNN